MEKRFQVRIETGSAMIIPCRQCEHWPEEHDHEGCEACQGNVSTGMPVMKVCDKYQGYDSLADIQDRNEMWIEVILGDEGIIVDVYNNDEDSMADCIATGAHTWNELELTQPLNMVEGE